MDPDQAISSRQLRRLRKGGRECFPPARRVLPDYSAIYTQAKRDIDSKVEDVESSGNLNGNPTVVVPDQAVSSKQLRKSRKRGREYLPPGRRVLPDYSAIYTQAKREIDNKTESVGNSSRVRGEAVFTRNSFEEDLCQPGQEAVDKFRKEVKIKTSVMNQTTKPTSSVKGSTSLPSWLGNEAESVARSDESRGIDPKSLTFAEVAKLGSISAQEVVSVKAPRSLRVIGAPAARSTLPRIPLGFSPDPPPSPSIPQPPPFSLTQPPLPQSYPHRLPQEASLLYPFTTSNKSKSRKYRNKHKTPHPLRNSTNASDSPLHVHHTGVKGDNGSDSYKHFSPFKRVLHNPALTSSSSLPPVSSPSQLHDASLTVSTTRPHTTLKESRSTVFQASPPSTNNSLSCNLLTQDNLSKFDNDFVTARNSVHSSPDRFYSARNTQSSTDSFFSAPLPRSSPIRTTIANIHLTPAQQRIIARMNSAFESELRESDQFPVIDGVFNESITDDVDKAIETMLEEHQGTSSSVPATVTYNTVGSRVVARSGAYFPPPNRIQQREAPSRRVAAGTRMLGSPGQRSASIPQSRLHGSPNLQQSLHGMRVLDGSPLPFAPPGLQSRVISDSSSTQNPEPEVVGSVNNTPSPPSQSRLMAPPGLVKQPLALSGCVSYHTAPPPGLSSPNGAYFANGGSSMNQDDAEPRVRGLGFSPTRPSFGIADLMATLPDEVKSDIHADRAAQNGGQSANENQHHPPVPIGFVIRQYRNGSGPGAVGNGRSNASSYLPSIGFQRATSGQSGKATIMETDAKEEMDFHFDNLSLEDNGVTMDDDSEPEAPPYGSHNLPYASSKTGRGQFGAIGAPVPSVEERAKRERAWNDSMRKNCPDWIKDDNTKQIYRSSDGKPAPITAGPPGRRLPVVQPVAPLGQSLGLDAASQDPNSIIYATKFPFGFPSLGPDLYAQPKKSDDYHSIVPVSDPNNWNSQTDPWDHGVDDHMTKQQLAQYYKNGLPQGWGKHKGVTTPLNAAQKFRSAATNPDPATASALTKELRDAETDQHIFSGFKHANMTVGEHRNDIRDEQYKREHDGRAPLVPLCQFNGQERVSKGVKDVINTPTADLVAPMVDTMVGNLLRYVDPAPGGYRALSKWVLTPEACDTSEHGNQSFFEDSSSTDASATSPPEDSPAQEQKEKDAKESEPTEAVMNASTNNNWRSPWAPQPRRGRRRN